MYLFMVIRLMSGRTLLCPEKEVGIHPYRLQKLSRHLDQNAFILTLGKFGSGNTFGPIVIVISYDVNKCPLLIKILVYWFKGEIKKFYVKVLKLKRATFSWGLRHRSWPDVISPLPSVCTTFHPQLRSSSGVIFTFCFEIEYRCHSSPQLVTKVLQRTVVHPQWLSW